MHKYRSHTCSEITKKNSGKTVKLSGWIHRKRDHGNLLFFDLRDHFGLTQCVVENTNEFFKVVEKIRPESVVCVVGKVVDRSSETINKDLFTGEVELKISSFEVLSEAKDYNLTTVCTEKDYLKVLLKLHDYFEINFQLVELSFQIHKMFFLPH